MTIVNGTINSNGVMAINTLNNNLNEIKEKVEQLENVNSERRTFI
jgi:hypothetical protein